MYRHALCRQPIVVLFSSEVLGKLVENTIFVRSAIDFILAYLQLVKNYFYKQNDPKPVYGGYSSKFSIGDVSKYCPSMVSIALA